MTATIWHDPRWSQSRAALALLAMPIERPPVTTGKGVRLTRPPERVIQIL